MTTRTRRANGGAPSTFEVKTEGAEVLGEGPKNRWISVRNITVGARLAPEQADFETNCFSPDGSYRLDVPESRYGDFVRVTESRPGVGVRHQIVQLRAGLDKATERQLYAAIQSSRLLVDDDGLRVESTRANRAFAPPFSRVWFWDADTEEVTSVNIGEHGQLPEDFRLPGTETSRYYVKTTAGDVEEQPSFRGTSSIAVGGRKPENFDHPKMKTHSGDLFVDGVHYSDPVQGRVGNCWFVASLSAIASAHPEKIEQMIIPLDDDRYRVDFHRFDKDADRYVLESVEVTPKFFRDFGPYYGRSSNSRFKGRMELWFPLLEKAYAQLRGGYRETAMGTAIDAFERILGAPATCHLHNTDADAHFSTLLDGVKRRQPMCAAAHQHFANVPEQYERFCRRLVARHSYTIVSAYERDGQRFVKLRNPQGSKGPRARKGVFEMPFDAFRATFSASMLGHLPKAPASEANES